MLLDGFELSIRPETWGNSMELREPHTHGPISAINTPAFSNSSMIPKTSTPRGSL